jgi:hypothetical protein
MVVTTNQVSEVRWAGDGAAHPVGSLPGYLAQSTQATALWSDSSPNESSAVPWGATVASGGDEIVRVFA